MDSVSFPSTHPQLTTWYYVVMDNELANQEIADALEEGSISLLLRPSLFREDDWIAYTLVSPGGGSKYFRAIGRRVHYDMNKQINIYIQID